MSDETEVKQEEIAEEGGYFDDLAKMLDSLVPPKEVTVADVSGKEYKLPGAIAARRQIKVFREFQSIWKNEEVKGHLNEAGDFSVSSIINAVMAVSFNEDVLEALGRAFQAGFPDLVEGDPLEHFAIEEVVTALVPLFMRFIKRAGKTLVGLGTVTGL